MGNPQTLLADLRAGRCSNTAEVRLLEARNVRKGSELMSLDMLFVDENVSNLSHGFVYIGLDFWADGDCSLSLS